ncbi:MAG: hypothetical protein NUK63_00075 [Candidatus Bathyarchaeum tardum]|nr:MAG: hypothetical protein NUK63_00075 [Candidatus Bathyarchaeum tardum]
MTEKNDAFSLGGILAVIGLTAIMPEKLQAVFFLVGIGVVFMASTSKDFQKQFFDAIFSVFKRLIEFVTGN